MTDTTVPVTQADIELAERIISNVRGYGITINPEHSAARSIAEYRLAAEQSRASTPAVNRDERAAIEAAIKETDYKYFGDYEMSDGQREAVEVLVRAAHSYLALHPPVMGEVEAENVRLREALEPFARYADSILKRRDGAQDEPVAVDRLVFGIDGTHITIGDLRRARATLSTEQVR